mmetsp:Transcript_21971/g.36361  ORF Transcript_21971/g.36361 Transcript_21971/m.36361 type:complete len:185 (+) Transcript_21971:124-678(+)|eukprot:CAMPEP_0119015760 /NCGR_PEP_ID=MMETSP1176-20130426/11552_1 /TAXON_ID=265551 /ORGANISM="Synedropsis recta cf, Strain CCMP1620" /LENGTH=184 /DNA_ID=CAMNT_0006969077 /DNA_START=100 /DNA_END=654 /DNA_ORIENTATION=+
MSTRAERPPSRTSSQKTTTTSDELTLDDIQSYTFHHQLKDDNENQRGASRIMGGMNGSTDGMMGSNDSLLSDEQSMDGDERKLKYETLRTSRLTVTGSSSRNGASTDALVDESEVSGSGVVNDSFSDEQAWKYPSEELEPYARGEASTGRSSRTKPRNKLSTQNSMRAMVGDDEKDLDYQKLRF